jgi:hypothetical protein
MLSGISSLPAVTLSRCIPITMERMLPGDRVEEIDEFIIEPEAQALFRRANVWASKNLSQLRSARPAAPSELGHRQREVCRPLFAIGDLAGSGWGDRIRSAVTALFLAQAKETPADVKVHLLMDLKEAFGDQSSIPSKELVESLVQLEDRPWASWGKSAKPMNPNQLARQLKDFKVYPQNLRTDGKVVKGYQRQWFEPLWARYQTDTQTATPLQPAYSLAETQFSNRYKDAPVADEKCEKPASILHCSGVADRNGGNGGQQVNRSGKPNGKTLPSCSKCGSFYLYKNSYGTVECMSCSS